jgi:nucleotide-binding universal stress UspA family protein
MSLFRRILVPYDFSEHASRALVLAGELAREHRGRLVVLHVIAPYHPVTGLPEEGMAMIPERDLVAGERRRLEALVARVLDDRPRVRADCRVVIGDPFHRITDAARHVDTIVMATAGRTGLAHLLIGSVAEKVVRHAPVPVLTVRPDGARAKGRSGRGRRGRRRAARRS